MGCNVLFSFTDDDLNISLEPEEMQELYDLIDAEMNIVNEVERNVNNGNIDNDIIEIESSVDLEMERNVNEVDYDGDDEHSDLDCGVNESDYDGDNEDSDLDCDVNELDYDNPPLLMHTPPEQSQFLSIPSPPILHQPVQLDPAQLLSWQIYNFSQQIDSYLNEFMSQLEQNTPPPPNIYYYPIRFEENLETGEQILDVVSIDIASIHY